MYSYKINNSYTVYVNWGYYNEVEAITASKKAKTKSSQSSSKKLPNSKKNVVIPISLGAEVKSKYFGVGTVTSKESTGIITVKFEKRTARFIYPDAFNKGHLVHI